MQDDWKPQIFLVNIIQPKKPAAQNDINQTQNCEVWIKGMNQAKQNCRNTESNIVVTIPSDCLAYNHEKRSLRKLLPRKVPEKSP